MEKPDELREAAMSYAVKEINAHVVKLQEEAAEREAYISELREAIYYPDKSLKPIVEKLQEENKQQAEEIKRMREALKFRTS
jgi:flagellar biosynthesis regulator FlaF